MIYEMRRYETSPGKMPELHERFRKYTIRLFEKHGMKPVAFWTSVIGEASNCLTYVLQFENLAAREKAWAAFLADEEWIKVFKKSNENGQIVVKVDNKIFAPTDYSPLQ